MPNARLLSAARSRRVYNTIVIPGADVRVWVESMSQVIDLPIKDAARILLKDALKEVEYINGVIAELNEIVEGHGA